MVLGGTVLGSRSVDQFCIFSWPATPDKSAVDEAGDMNPEFGLVAAKGGDVEALRNTIEAAPTSIHWTDARGLTPLHVATAEGHEECITLLLEAKADVDARDAADRTAIFYAARDGKLEIVERLLRAEADPDARNHQGMTPLFRACESGHPFAARALVAARADTNAKDNVGRTPCLVAAQLNNWRCISELLLSDQQPDLRLRNNYGRSALQVARMSRNHEAAALLALCTLDYDDVEDEEVPPRKQALYEADPRPPVLEMVRSIPELLSTVGGGQLLTCLPYTFSRRPLDTCFAIVRLVGAYRKHAFHVYRTDEKGGDALLDAAYEVWRSAAEASWLHADGR